MFSAHHIAWALKFMSYTQVKGINNNEQFP